MVAKLCERCSVIQLDDSLLTPFPPPGDNYDDYTMGPWAELRLDYDFVDVLPTLPSLQLGAEGGCGFCSLLRAEIIRADFDYTGSVRISLAYCWRDEAFPGCGLAALVAHLDWRPDIPSVPPASEPPNTLHESIVFAVESDDSVVASWLGIPRLRHEKVLCDENVKFMRKSLDTCMSECDHLKAGDFLPSRLLDLGQRPGQVRLVSSKDLNSASIAPKDIKYAALSYCWGSSTDEFSHTHTYSDNLGIRETGIEENSLSPVIREAIDVSRALSIQYMWVDSLCIIQDDITDWEHESSLMSLVYGNAWVTLCILSSAAQSQSFLNRERHLISVGFKSIRSPGVSGHYKLVGSGTTRSWVLSGWPKLDVERSVWNRRGWTLQENLMSPRKILFGSSMVHFLCSNYSAAENGCHTPRGSRMAQQTAVSTDLVLKDAQAWDLDILYTYGDRSYSVAHDRLPGISGLAKLHADRTGDQYLAGLWRSDLLYGLMWFSYDPIGAVRPLLRQLVDELRDAKRYIAPSWSPIRLVGYSIERGLRFTDRVFGRGTFRDECRILEGSTTPTGSNHFGRIESGFIRVRGRVADVPSDIVSLMCHYWPPKLSYVRDEEKIVAYFNMDCSLDENGISRDNLTLLMLLSYEGSLGWKRLIHQASVEDNGACWCRDSSEDVDVLSGPKFSEARHIELPPSQGRNAYGLVLHPAREQGSYFRVGVFASVAGDGAGTRYFEQFDEREVDIV